jgi:GT2 family glycosyltransferase
MPKSSSPLNKIVLYTPYAWDRSLPIIRILGPLEMTGFQVIQGNDWETCETFPNRVDDADLVVIQRDFPRDQAVYEEILQKARSAGKKVIFDLDDLLLELPADHPDRGIDYYTAAAVPMVKAIVEADAVTVSSAGLVEYIRPYNPNVRLLPNYLDDRLWRLDAPELKPEKASVVIGYLGGNSHLPDLSAITPALVSILAHFTDRVILRVWGCQLPPELAAMSNVEKGPFFPAYADFASHAREISCDLVIAPLNDNLFNRCKSSIKFFEYSALGVPGIYSRIAPYEIVVTDGENGLLAGTLEEWEEDLSRLIEDPGLRYRLACGAQDSLREKWLLSQHAHLWAEAYGDILGQTVNPSSPPFLERVIGQVQQFQKDADRLLKERELLLINSRREAEISELNAHWAAKKAAYEAELAARDQTVQTLVQNVHALELNVQTQKNQIIEKESTISELGGRLAEIDSSRAFQLVRVMWRIRLWLAPNGSLQARVLALGFRSIRVLAREGPGAALRAIPRKIRKLLRRETEQQVIAGTTEPQASSSPKTVWLSSPDAPIDVIPRQFDVIIFPIIDWDFRFQRPQQLAVQFARNGHRVFFVNTAFRQEADISIRTVHSNIYEIGLPGTIGLNLYKDQLDANSLKSILTAFELLIDQLSIHDTVCLVELPFWEPAAFELRKRYGWKVVYDCMDYHRGFSTNTELMVSGERLLIQSADLVLTTSHLLFEECSQLNPSCTLVPNAADFSYFNIRPDNTPPDISDLKHPIIGYYGAISNWFDTDLVSSLAEARPNWMFLLIGNTTGANLYPLSRLPNVRLLGEKPYEELTAYLYLFDVCVIPFAKTPLTEATNPVKLFEFFSAGKPVVATELNELKNYRNLVYLASTPAEWLDAIQTCLSENDRRLVEARIAFARNNTWESRSGQIQNEIVRCYPKASLIILTYNNLSLTQQCLESIIDDTIYPNFEIVVVDNCSTDNTPQYLQDFSKQHSNVRVILNDSNRGFSAGMNQGIQAGDGDYVVLMNNDIVVTPGWLGRLLHHLENDHEIGMIGPVTNATGNEACIETSYQSMDEMREFARKMTHAHKDVYPLREFAMFCVAMRRSLVNQLGLLDERFTVGMFEDDDYAMRIRQEGYKILCAQDVFIHHHNLASFKALPVETYVNIYKQNRVKFDEKWQTQWKEPKVLPQAILLNTYQQLGLILNTHQDRKGVVIFPPTIGWSITLFQRPHQLARAFAKMGYLVFFCETREESTFGYGFKEQESNLYLGCVPLEVFDQVKEPIVFEYVYNKDALHYFRKPTVIFDHVDDLSVFPYDPDLIKRNFAYLVAHAHLVVTTAELLAQAVSEERSDAILVPNGVDFDHFRKAYQRETKPPADLAPVVIPGTPIIGYYGALARWFDYDLLAYAAQVHPDYHFLLIGPAHDDSLEASKVKTIPNVFWLGPRDYQVLPQYLAWFDVATIPFVLNEITLSTSPIKLFEYLAAGKPVVTTAMPECRKHFGVSVAENDQEYVVLLEKAVGQARDKNFKKAAQDEASRFDWMERARQIVERLPAST